MKKINVCIVHYNTPKLTECLVKSINLHTPNCFIYIFDNSDRLSFTYKQDNLRVFDNTKGQIIDFEKELENYPDHLLSSAKKNNYGSAKHCMSVQQCMSLIDDNFILLDSDILLKCDISDFFDENYASIGDTELWKPSNPIQTQNVCKNRIKPYICFINTNLYKRYNIKYFEEKHIYGLCREGDYYDTGSYLHEQIVEKHLPFKKLDINKYIVHYKAGSWLEEARLHDNYQRMSPESWLETYQEYWKERASCVIYTCITGGYDQLKTLTYKDPNFDYVCYTNDLNIENHSWLLRKIPVKLKDLSPVKQARYIKTRPHEFFSEYELSVWIDGNIDVLDDISPLINNHSISIPTHPLRDCIYDEGRECIRLKKDIIENVNNQLDRYRRENFPEHFGLVQSNIIIRRHNREDCICLMNDWWREIERGSHRDQLSFNYVLWKNPSTDIVYLDKHIYDSKYFFWNPKHNHIKKQTKEVTVTIKHSSLKNYKKFLAISSLNKNVVKYKDSHYDVTYLFNEKNIDKKPLCVLGSAQTNKGKIIEKELLSWLSPIYNVVLVRHDGTMYEYPALSYMRKLCMETHQSCLYIHTRGAYNTRTTTLRTHRMWKYEFGTNYQRYFDIVNVNEPTVACPFTGTQQITWYNGFVANAKAMSKIDLSLYNKDRKFYEEMFRDTCVNVRGVIIETPDGVDRPYNSLIQARKYLKEHYRSAKVI